MKKAKNSMLRASLLLLAVVLLAIPLSGVACSDEDGFKADFEASPTSGDSPLTVSFTDKSKGDITKWEWDLDGDNIVDSTEQNPTFTYYTPDQWTVSLRVTNAEQEIHKEIKENYINTTGVVYPTKHLRLTSTFIATDPVGLCVEKFKELIEMYTGGNVTVEIFHDRVLYSEVEEFTALQTGAIDMMIHHPGFTYHIDFDTYPIGSISTGLILNIDHARAVAADPWIHQYALDKWAEYNMRFLGYMETVFAGVFLGSTELTDMSDFAGKKYNMWAPMPAPPRETYFGVESVHFGQADIMYGITMGEIDIATSTPEIAYDYGLYQLLPHVLLEMLLAPTGLFMNMDVWNDLGSDLQDLIENTIIPELQEYTTTASLDNLKVKLKALYEAAETFHVTTAERKEEIWNIVKNEPVFEQLEKGQMDPDLYAAIEALRPTTPGWHPIVIDVLTYAGIPID